MRTARQKLPVKEYQIENISILLVTASIEDVVALRHILRHGDWHIVHARTIEEGKRCVSAEQPSVILCDRELPDGTWKDLLHADVPGAASPLLLVACRQADERLWAEVLNLGGYDVLMKPFEAAEVTRVVSMAWRFWSGSARALTGVQQQYL